MSQCHLTCSGVKRLPQKCPVVSWWCGLEYMVDSGHLISQIFRGRPGRDGFYTPQTSWILEPLMTDHLSPWPNHNFGLHGAPNSPSTNAMLRPHALWHQRHGSWIGLETEAAAQWIRRTSFKTYPIHVWRVHFFKGSWRLSAEICFSHSEKTGVGFAISILVSVSMVIGGLNTLLLGSLWIKWLSFEPGKALWCAPANHGRQVLQTGNSSKEDASTWGTQGAWGSVLVSELIFKKC